MYNRILLNVYINSAPFHSELCVSTGICEVLFNLRYSLFELLFLHSLRKSFAENMRRL